MQRRSKFADAKDTFSALGIVCPESGARNSVLGKVRAQLVLYVRLEVQRDCPPLTRQLNLPFW